MIHAENLTRYYKDLCAVDRINFDIQKGEIMGLLGPNGAGKTTVLRMLTGYLKPTSGTIQVKEYGIDTHPLQIKKLMGYLPEAAPLYQDMLVYDYLHYVANIRELERQQKMPRVRHLADLCGLNGVMHKPIGELSKGFKQRVGLAHAMMNDPEILIMDEPTSGLDPNQIIEIRQIIKEIGKEKTVILSTHILNEAEATCDRVMIINQGKIVADGSMDTLKQKGRGEDIISISLKKAEYQSVEKELCAIDGVISVAEDDGEDEAMKVKVVCKSSTDLREEIYMKVKATDWILLELTRETQTLENIFQDLTKEN